MSREISEFRYLFDPIFQIALLIYFINKYVFSVFDYFHSGFLAYYLNDLLLIPVVLPILLYLAEILNFRRSNGPPSFIEIIIPVTIWIISFELIGPHMFEMGTADIVDAFAYIVGATVSWWIWNNLNYSFGIRS